MAKMNTLIQKSITLIFSGLFSCAAFAQTAPDLSYTSPGAYKVGTMISPLGPANSGGTGAANGQATTFAGDGTAGSTNGTGATASFNKPLAIAQDAQNNLYVADYTTHIIRKITPAGVVTTIAGTAGASGTTNANGAAARFSQPRGLVVDAAGNIYVADYGNNMIRKITPAGDVTTVAGSITAGHADGNGTAASFYGPIGLAIDGAGNILVTDYSNHTIRKVTPAGDVTTLAGFALTSGSTEGSLSTARFNHPYGIGVDQWDNIYIADRTNCRVRKINTSTGIVSTLAGSSSGFTNQTGNLAKFNNPCGLSLDAAGNVYVADNTNNCIRKVTPAGVVTTLSGTGVLGYSDGSGDASQFNSPFSLCADNDGGFLYVGDYSNRIRKVAISPYTISPDLPAGLSFDIATGVITGTPETTLASTTYTVTEYNGTGLDTAPATLSVTAADALSLSDQNYVTTYIPRIAGITSSTLLLNNISNQSHIETAIQYMDGLGRPMQVVQVKASPAGKDIVQPIVYDQFGREQTKYLPYADNSSTYGNYKTNALTAGSGQAQFYASPPSGVSSVPYPSAQTGFEPSPLNRVLEQGAPGAAWQLTNSGVSGSGHTVEIAYTSNDITAITDTINTHIAALYTISAINASTQERTLARGSGVAGNYTVNQLYVTITKDENWTSGRAGQMEEYKDVEGHVVLKRLFNYVPGTTPLFQILSTYYVYDERGNLAYVLPPMANADAALPTQSTLDNLCYQYRYDERNRLTQKKIPGKGWEYIVYNKLDQPVLTQDVNQRAGNQWAVTKYDALGRVVMTGLWNAGSVIPLSTLQASIYAGAQWDARDYTNNTTGYNVSSYPALSKTLGINYYDDYNNIPSLPAIYQAPLVYDALPEGAVTATRTAVLNTITNTTPDMLWSVHYYDALGRGIETYQQHYFNGTLSINNYDDVATTYDFTNAPVATTREHWNANSTAAPQVRVMNSYIYDAMGRKLMSWEQISNGYNVPTANTLLSRTEYNEVGQLWKKHLHSTDWVHFMQDISYTYNERGWLATSSAPLFAMQLYYNTGTNKGWNGNIMYQWSGVPGNLANHYSYKYDKLNRILSGTSTGMFNETGITYDLNGNIATLKRTNGSSTVTDDLAYTYTSSTNPTNQLQSITDATTSDVGLKHGTFAYTYDGNGNQLTDPAKGPTGITLSYSLLNLPQTVTGSKAITYTYDAAGQKLRRVSTTPTGGTGKTDYISGIQYDDNNSGTETLSFIQTEEGKAVPATAGSYNYVYYLGDQLGNTRVTFDTQSGSAGLLQTDNYYPFGMEQTVGPIVSTKNEYLYNKKELQEELGEYDYGARFYDPVIGRWTSVDPLAEQGRRWSPYVYAFDSPIRFTDPDGMWPDWGGWRSAISEGFVSHYQSIKQVFTTNPVTTLKRIAIDVARHPGETLANTATGGLYGKIKESYTLAKSIITGDAKTGGHIIGNTGANLLDAAVPIGAGKVISALRGASSVAIVGADGTADAASGLKLAKQLTSEQQLGEPGDIIAGGNSGSDLRKATDLASQYGGNAADWVKKTSSNSGTFSDGQSFETHWEENLSTGERVNIKTKQGDVKTPTAESLNPKDPNHK